MNVERIMELLKEKGWSRYRLSKVSGVSEDTISLIIRKMNKDIKLSTVIKIANALDVPIDEIVNR